jgi:two-component system chemotaxis response regulator CheB
VPADRTTNGESSPPARLVVIGASAGGVEALSKLAKQLPEEFPAAIVVVLHVPPTGTSFLPNILDRRGRLPAHHARNGDAIEPGHIYVAPPDEHLLVEHDQLRLTRGPRENNHRPAIDPTFRSAALAYRSALVAVVLSGVLDDGTAGLRSVKLMGGTTIVQDPEDALYRAMPESAIFHVRPDHVVPLADLPSLLVRLATKPESTPREEIAMDTSYEQESDETMHAEDMAGEPAGVSCPDCGGSLWETHEGDLTRYRCLVGHVYSADSLVAAQAISLETALWTSLRALEDRARIAFRLAERLDELGVTRNASRFREQAQEAERNAAVVRHVLDRTETAVIESPAVETA